MSLKKFSMCLDWSHKFPSYRRMVPPMTMKSPLLTVGVFWLLLVALFFTTRTTRSP